MAECQFCGKKTNSEKYLNIMPSQSKGEICSECSEYCLKKCRLPVIACPSWHSEKCLQCIHNPYNQHKDKFKHNGKRWVKNE